MGPGEPHPNRPCHTCKGSNWRQHTTGARSWVCNDCHPDPTIPAAEWRARYPDCAARELASLRRDRAAIPFLDPPILEHHHDPNPAA